MTQKSIENQDQDPRTTDVDRGLARIVDDIDDHVHTLEIVRTVGAHDQDQEIEDLVIIIGRHQEIGVLVDDEIKNFLYSFRSHLFKKQCKRESVLQPIPIILQLVSPKYQYTHCELF